MALFKDFGASYRRLCNFDQKTQSFIKYHISKRLLSSWSSSKSPYEILGINRSSTDKDIKKAYLKLAKQYHPDTNKSPDAANKFKEISTAYEILSNSKKRAEFENQNAFNSKRSGFGFNDANNNNFSHSKTYTYSSSMNPEDIFKEFFKNSSWTSDFFSPGDASHQSHGQYDKYSQSNQTSYRTMHNEPRIYEMDLQISFLDSVLGCTKEKMVELNVICSTCKGNGADPSSAYQRCSNCNGSGYKTSRLSGFMMVQTFCNICQGTGKTVTRDCSQCHGQGQIFKRTSIKINVPAGTLDKQTLRTSALGCEIIVRLSVLPSQMFWREGKNIHSYLQISYPQAFLGSTLDVDGIHGRFKINIPPGTSSHDEIVKSGQGIRSCNSFTSHGDHIIHIKIKTPKPSDDKEKALVMALANIECNESEKRYQDPLEYGNKYSGSKISKNDPNDPHISGKNHLSFDEIYKGMKKTAQGWVFNVSNSIYNQIYQIINPEFIPPVAKNKNQKVTKSSES